MSIPDDDFVFNVVMTGTTFPYLRYFIASQIAHSAGRFRLVVNGCPPDQVAAMERFRERFPQRVTEVFTARDRTEAHGVALDDVFAQRDDGDFFATIDPDIAASGRFVADFAERLEYGAAGVTSGRGVWRDDDRVPPGHPGVSGEYFFDERGFLFGSPHFAMYRRDALVATMRRWDIGFRSAGPGLSDAATAVLRSQGFDYMVYDTGKLVNIFLQHDGGRLEHFEHRHLMHIGGMSHYLSQPDVPGGATDDPVWPWPVTRLEVARYCAAVLHSLSTGSPAPPVPGEVEESVRARLERVRATIVDLVTTYGPLLEDR